MRTIEELEKLKAAFEERVEQEDSPDESEIIEAFELIPELCQEMIELLRQK